MLQPLHLPGGAFLIQPKQPRQDFIVIQRTRAPVIAPAIGFGHRLIQRLMCMVEPGGAGVVEVGQGAFLQLLFRLFVHGQDAVGIARHHLGDAADQIGRIEPVFAQFIQPCRGGRDFLGARVGGVGGGGNVGGQAVREGEGFEGGGGGIAGVVPHAEERAQARVQTACP